MVEKSKKIVVSILIVMFFIAYCSCFYVDFRNSRIYSENFAIVNEKLEQSNKEWQEKAASSDRKIEQLGAEVNELRNKLKILEEDLVITSTLAKITRLPRLLLCGQGGFSWILDRCQPFNISYNSFVNREVYYLIFTTPVKNITSCKIYFNSEKMIDDFSEKQAMGLAISTKEGNVSYDFRYLNYKGKATYIECPDFGKPGYYLICIGYTLLDETKRTDIYYID